jgi:ABC-type uncharacterized transport system involved in gliding motility auxiliary subunit
MKWNRREIAQFSAVLGGAFLLSGYIRHSIQGVWLTLNKSLLIAGGVLLLAGIILGFDAILSFFSARSSKLGTNTAILALAVLAILVLANFVGYRHHKRFDLTSEKLHTLSDQSKKIVAGLNSDVTIIRFAKAPDQQFDDLMTEYRSLSPHIKFQDIDPQQKPEIARQYSVTRPGDIVVASGSRTEHIDSGFRSSVSEEDITTNILKITRNSVKTVCFVTGHGEKSLAETGDDGYSAAATGLKNDAYATKSINLVSENGVPADCSIVVIAGPTQGFFPQEVQLLTKFLNDGGKALILLDPETDPKLDDIFNVWNLKVGHDVVIDASGVGRLFGLGPAIPLVIDYGASPITKGFERSMTFFPLARTVSIADKGKSDPQDIELLKTSPRSYSISNLKRKDIQFDPKTDTMGPLSLGVAAGKSGEKAGRVVVIGDSDFAANRFYTSERNGDLFLNTINWLAEDENLISIRPKSITNRRVTLTEGQASGLRWLDMIFLPGLVLVSGIYIWWKRR